MDLYRTPMNLDRTPHHAFATAISEQGSGDPSPYWLKFGEDFGGWRLPFGSLVHYRPPKPVLKSLPKFSPTSIPGIFVGWHLEPGCRWRGDYLVISLGQFKVPGRRNFSIHRIKEVVSFDAMHFPLQASRMAELSTVDCPSPEGEVIGPDQVEEEVKEDWTAGSSRTWSVSKVRRTPGTSGA